MLVKQSSALLFALLISASPAIHANLGKNVALSAVAASAAAGIFVNPDCPQSRAKALVAAEQKVPGLVAAHRFVYNATQKAKAHTFEIGAVAVIISLANHALNNKGFNLPSSSELLNTIATKTAVLGSFFEKLTTPRV